MVIKINRLIVVDLECTCWDEPGKQDDMEIIEIGICMFHSTTGIIDQKQSVIVRPQNMDISEYCTKLTGLTEARIRKEGAPLNEALNRLRKEYPFKSCGWGSWGYFDNGQIVKECAKKNIPYPFNRTHMNLKYLYGMIRRQKRGVGVTRALAQLGMQFEGRHHCGGDDAYNTARILRHILGWAADESESPV